MRRLRRFRDLRLRRVLRVLRRRVTLRTPPLRVFRRGDLRLRRTVRFLVDMARAAFLVSMTMVPRPAPSLELRRLVARLMAVPVPTCAITAWAAMESLMAGVRRGRRRTELLRRRETRATMISASGVWGGRWGLSMYASLEIFFSTDPNFNASFLPASRQAGRAATDQADHMRRRIFMAWARAMNSGLRLAARLRLRKRMRPYLSWNKPARVTPPKVWCAVPFHTCCLDPAATGKPLVPLRLDPEKVLPRRRALTVGIREVGPERLMRRLVMGLRTVFMTSQ